MIKDLNFVKINKFNNKKQNELNKKKLKIKLNHI